MRADLLAALDAISQEQATREVRAELEKQQKLEQANLCPVCMDAVHDHA